MTLEECFRKMREGWWEDESKGVLRAELFDEAVAGTIGRKTKVTNSQLRRFYDELKGLDQRVQTQPAVQRDLEFRRVLPLVKRTLAIAQYAASKSGQSGGIPEDFLKFLKTGINGIRDYQDLHAFVLLFETVAGYAKTS